MAAEQAQQIDVYKDKQLIKSIVFVIGVDQYFINGQTPGVKMDAAPFIDSGRTFVPVRFLGNAIGITNDNIAWDSALQKATLVCDCGSQVEMIIGKNQIITNGQAKDIDVTPQLKPPGRTFLPARFVVEALGYEVDWQDEKYVVVWPKGEPKPDVTPVKDYVNQLINTKEVNGYRVPIVTELKVDPCEEILYGVEIDVLIRIYKPLDGQYQDLRTMLTSKFDGQVIDQVISYVKQKNERDQELALKKWSVNGYSIEVASNAGNFGIQVLVRKQ